MRSSLLAFAAFLVCAAPLRAQDFAFGVLNGQTNSRQLLHSGATPLQRGAVRGLAGAILIKPWLSLSLDVTLADKGLLPTRARPHRYFEIPYLVRLASPWALLHTRPFVQWGAAYAYELSCDTLCASADRVTTDASMVTGFGLVFQQPRWEFAVESRRMRGLNSLSHDPNFYATSDVRALFARFSLIIPGVAPDWF